MLHIGLTGGIASGKSTVAEIFGSLGAIVIDLDRLAHEVMATDELLRMDLEGYFGSGVLNPDGTIDRAELARIVFNSKDDLNALNGIVHPHVSRRWQERIDDIQREQPDAVVVSDVPLLLEAGLAPLFDLVILVYVPQAEQLRRLMARNNISAAEARGRLAAQWPIDEKKSQAHLVIDNQGEIGRTRDAIHSLWGELQNRAREMVRMRDCEDKGEVKTL